METNKHYLYVVECKDGTYYAGYTTDIHQRMKKHNEGKGAKYTRGRGPITLLFSQEFETKEEAMRAEYRFKRLKRPEKERLLAMESEERYVAAKSFQPNYEYGTLYLVPTPIGNLEDMTFRAIKIMKESAYIAAEDTRQTKKLCNYFEIETPVISYHEHNKKVSGDKILSLLREGKDVALVSDAGMPTISDPGYELVVEAVQEKMYVVPLPGANAALTSLIASGLPTQPFYFYGFLDRNKKEKRKQLEGLAHIQATMLFYEAPHRLKETLKLIKEVLGNRQITVSRELTKKFEEFIRGDLDEVLAWTEEDTVRGEFCLVVEGAQQSELVSSEVWWEHLSIEQHVNHYVETGAMTTKEAIKQVAKDRNQQKREIYQEYHGL